MSIRFLTPVRLPVLPADPDTPLDGDLWVSGGKLRGRAGGVSADLTAAAVARATASATASNVSAGAELRTSITLPRSFLLLSIQTSHAARVRLYASDAGAANDVGRPITDEPAATADLIMEFATSATMLTSPIAPAVPGSGPSTTVPLTVGNRSAATTANITVTLTYLPLES